MILYYYRKMIPLKTHKMPPAKLDAAGNLTFSLPIPARAISPNAKRGESKFAAIKKGRIVKSHRLAAGFVLASALNELGIKKPQFIGYSLAFFFRTAAYRDDDNADGSCKAYRDGMADILRMNDKDLKKLAISTHATDAECPRVDVTLLLRQADLAMCDASKAPKDGSIILGAFGWPWLLPAVWCEFSQEWVTITKTSEALHQTISRGWEMGCEKHSALLGWLPMPELPAVASTANVEPPMRKER